MVSWADSVVFITWSIKNLEDALIHDWRATFILTKSLENCTLCKPNVVEIQTAHHDGATLMSTPHIRWKKFICNWLREVRLFIVKAYVVQGLKYDLLLVNVQDMYLITIQTQNNLGYLLWSTSVSSQDRQIHINSTYEWAFKFQSEIRTNLNVRKTIWVIGILLVATDAGSCVKLKYSRHT